MSDRRGSVTINNELTDPLGDFVIDYLLSQTKETNYLDFKATLDISRNSNDFPKIIKDVYGFSNAGGGYLVLGVHQNDHSNNEIKGAFVKLGLPEDFTIEQASLQEKINSYLDISLEIGYAEFIREFDGKKRRFAIIYIPPSPKILIPSEDGIYRDEKKEKKAFLKGAIYTRRGTQCIIAECYEIDQMKKRVKKEQYRLSIISGEPDNVKEVLYSNLFEVTSLPKFVYVGTAIYSSFIEAVTALKKNHSNRYFNLRYQSHEDKIITFQNLTNPDNYHHEIVSKDSIHKESIDKWLDGGDKEKIIIALLNKEVRAHGSNLGMYFDNKNKRLYYPVSDKYRSEAWSTRHGGIRTKQVAKLMYAEQLKKEVYVHAAVRPTITKLHDKFYLRLNPTMVITDDGKHVTKDPRAGTIITRMSYNKYNNSFLNSVLFWISKLGDGNDLFVEKGIVISHEPVQTTINTGINWDIPTSDLKNFIEEYNVQSSSEEKEEEPEEGDQHDY